VNVGALRVNRYCTSPTDWFSFSCSHEIVYRVPYYGFTNLEERPYLRLSFRSEAPCRKAARLFQSILGTSRSEVRPEGPVTLASGKRHPS